MSGAKSSLQQYSDWYDNLRKVSLDNPLTSSSMQNRLNLCSYRDKKLSKTDLEKKFEEESFESDDNLENSSDISSNACTHENRRF